MAPSAKGYPCPIALIIACALFGVLGCTGPSTPSPTRSSVKRLVPESPLVITAGELALSYRKDPARFDQSYKDQEILVQGTVRQAPVQGADMISQKYGV